MDLQEAFDAGFEAVKAYVERSFDAFEARIEAIERRFDALPTLRDGKDADLGEVRQIIAEEFQAVRAMVETLPAPPSLPDIPSMIAEGIEAAIAALPAPQDGKDADLGEVRQIIANEIAELKEAIGTIEPPDLPDIPTMVAEAVQDAVNALPAPQDGKSITLEDVAPLIASEVEKQVGEIPRPKDGAPGKDGESVDPEEVQRMVSEAVDKAIAAIPAPKDGADGENGKDGTGLAGAFIDRDGELVVTLTNGEAKKLGPVIGKDGKPGEPGKDGRDGFGFEDLDLVDTDEGLVLRFIRAGEVKDFRLPVVIDRGVYKEGQNYRSGDGVTWGGSYWICQHETTEKPDSGKGFRLAVKKGRDGRDAVMKEARPSEPVRVGVPGKAG